MVYVLHLPYSGSFYPRPTMTQRSSAKCRRVGSFDSIVLAVDSFLRQHEALLWRKITIWHRLEWIKLQPRFQWLPRRLKCCAHVSQGRLGYVWDNLRQYGHENIYFCLVRKRKKGLAIWFLFRLFISEKDLRRSNLLGNRIDWVLSIP